MQGVSRRLHTYVICTKISRTVIVTGAIAACFDPAGAQTPLELPGVVVQGASIAVGSSRARGAQDQGGTGAAGAVDSEGTDTGGSGQLIADQGTAVTVLTGEDLRHQQIRNAADALRSLPGVSVSRQGTAQSLTVVRLRGAESNHTLVLIDGVQVNSGTTDNFFDFSNLVAEDIERIEVLRGPQSGLYGSGALGGVINIITKQGRGPLTVRVRAETGSFRTNDGSIQVSGGDERAHGILTLYGRRTDGFNVSLTGGEKDFGQVSNFSFSGGLRPFENLKLEGTLRETTVRGGRDNGFGGVRNGFAVPADDDSKFGNKLWLGRVAATLDTLDGRWTHQWRLGRAQMTTTDHDATFLSDRESIGVNTKLGYTSTYRLDGPTGIPVRHFITGLVEREEESFVQPLGGDGIKRERGRTGLVGEVRGEYFKSLFLSGTVRRDDNEGFADVTTWRTTGALKLPNTPFRFHASLGTAAKYPSFSEQFGFFIGFLPNPNLKPEHSRGWDAGVETTVLGGRAVVDVTYFDQDLRDEIDFRTVPIFLFQPFNRAGASKRQGVELAGRYLVMPGLTLGAAYTYLAASEDDGKQEIRRPRHSGRLDANYAFAAGRGNLNLAVVYNGAMKDLAFEAGPPFGSQQVALNDYWLVNAAASYRIQPGVELYGRVENLLDQKYQEVFGFNTPGLAGFVGVRLSYEDRPLEARQ